MAKPLFPAAQLEGFVFSLIGWTPSKTAPTGTAGGFRGHMVPPTHFVV